MTTPTRRISFYLKPAAVREQKSIAILATHRSPQTTKNFLAVWAGTSEKIQHLPIWTG